MAKIAMIGAGSIGFTRRLMRDILAVGELADTQFAFTDISKPNLDMVAQLCKRDIEFNKLPAKISYCFYHSLHLIIEGDREMDLLEILIGFFSRSKIPDGLGQALFNELAHGPGLGINVLLIDPVEFLDIAVGNRCRPFRVGIYILQRYDSLGPDRD